MHSLIIKLTEIKTRLKNFQATLAKREDDIVFNNFEDKPKLVSEL